MRKITGIAGLALSIPLSLWVVGVLMVMPGTGPHEIRYDIAASEGTKAEFVGGAVRITRGSIAVSASARSPEVIIPVVIVCTIAVAASMALVRSDRRQTVAV